MKHLALLLSTVVFFVLCGINANAQSDTLSDDYVTVDPTNYQIKTLIGPGMTYGGYGSFDIGFGSIDGNQYIELGGTGALVLDHCFSIGLTGAGFATPLKYNSDDGNGMKVEDKIYGGYGGLFFEAILFPKKPIHISIPLVLGVGGYQSENYSTSIYESDIFDDDDYEFSGDVFLIAKPGARVEVNLLPFFRISTGVDFRLTDMDLNGYEMKAMDNISYSMSFKFGHF